MIFVISCSYAFFTKSIMEEKNKFLKSKEDSIMENNEIMNNEEVWKQQQRKL